MINLLDYGYNEPYCSNLCKDLRSRKEAGMFKTRRPVVSLADCKWNRLAGGTNDSDVSRRYL